MSGPDASAPAHLLRRPAAAAPRPARGFTLLEVLAAVALLGILYTVLARVAIEGLRAEGESKRRLEASLIADELISELFPTVFLPPIGHTERTEGDFTITEDVTAFQLPPDWSAAQSDLPNPLLLVPGNDGRVAALRTLQLTVSWAEGADERHVSRTTYLLDMQALNALGAAVTPTANSNSSGATTAPGLGQQPTAPAPDEDTR
jgi:prepilin-type N-terminal cleavage/methylation domain-containing protein